VIGLKGGLAPVVACEKPAHDQNQCAERKEAEVEAEDLVIDKALHQVEGAPAEQDPADQCSSACRPAPLVCSSPQNPKADYDDDHVKAWKSPSASVLSSSPENGRFRMPALAAEHVVPLKDLVENDFRPQTRPDRCPGGFRGRVDV
jgi:hypothetical protein